MFIFNLLLVTLLLIHNSFQIQYLKMFFNLIQSVKQMYMLAGSLKKIYSS